MGIVKISDQMHENLRITSTALSRSINAQAEHWLRVGMLTELNPHLNHHDISQLLIRLSQKDALDLSHCLTSTKQDAASTTSLVKDTHS